jgi:murein DD-endopeptidase MepM/ murein hydrolase activator NlpD
VSDRTFKVGSKLMEGSDVKAWQELIDKEFRHLKINCPIKKDGVYGVHTRSYSAALLKARGILIKEMESGVTPGLRSKIRNRELTKTETKRFHSAARVKYRKELREQWKPRKVHKPVNTIIADSWDYHPGVHDGIDVICGPNAAVFAMVKCKVIDVRAGGWWGNAPSGDVKKGDGIVQVEILENVGPFKKGYHIGYGHCEHARVRVGEIVQAGEVIALAGLAVAWHVHLMYNDGSTTRGIGNRDPRAILEYSKKHG